MTATPGGVPPRRRARARPRVAVLALAVALVGGACQAHVDVAVHVDDDASGEVRVGVGLDAEALDALGPVEDPFATDDLVARGWSVTGPATEDDGLTWVRAAKPFSSPEEATAVLAEVSGPGGPFAGFAVTRSRGALRDRLAVTGTVDLTDGLDGFADEDVRARLGGDVVARLRSLRPAGSPEPEDAFRFRVAVALPGDLSSNAPVEVGGSALWTPSLGDRLELAARSSRLRTATMLWWSVAAAALAAVLGVLLARWRRRRAGRSGSAGSDTPPP